MYVRCDESSLYSRINYVHSLTGNFSAGVSGIIKTMHTGFKRIARIALCQHLVLTRKKPDVMI